MDSAAATGTTGDGAMPRTDRRAAGRGWSFARDVVTPGTAVLFVVSTVTGIMLLLHWQGGLVHAAHEWLSVLFSVVAIWHLVRNWRAFTLYLRRNAPRVAILTTIALSLAFTAATARGPGDGNPRAVIGALAAQPLSAVAPALGLEPARAVVLLHAAGIDAAGDESLAAIAARSGRDVLELAAIVVAGSSR